MTTAIQPVRHAPAQRRESARVLARAFDDDPLTMFIFPDAASRPRHLAWFFERALRIGEMYGEVYTTPGKVDGDAIWLRSVLGMGQMVRAGILMAPLKFGLPTFMRFLGVMNHAEHLHKRDVPEPHHYLMVLGVDPPRQGQGVGGALIAPMLARADAERLPCYLETMKTRNVPFYEKHGFRVVVEADLPKGGPHFWTMKRPPKA